jgi:hypothetical protein
MSLLLIPSLFQQAIYEEVPSNAGYRVEITANT